ncbi:MAG: CvpA family protein [Anaerolineae bacterium]
MNWVDGVFIVVLALFTAAGAWQGVFRQTMGFLTFLLGLIFASYFRELPEGFIRFFFPASSAAAVESISFVGVFAVSVVVLATIARISFPVTRFQGLWVFDQFFGGLVSALTTGLQFGLAAFLLQYLDLTWLGSTELGQTVVAGIEMSALTPFSQAAVVALATLFTPGIPGGLPNFFVLFA